MSKNDAIRNCYLYLLDTLADWEVAHLTAELHSCRFSAGARPFRLTFIGADTAPVETMGGMPGTALEFAYEIFKKTDAMRPKVLEAWYQLYRTGESHHFFALMEALQKEPSKVV